MPKRVYTPIGSKICHLCGRGIMKANYVRLANMGETDQAQIEDARRDSVYFHHHCWEAYKRQTFLKNIASPSAQT